MNIYPFDTKQQKKRSNAFALLRFSRTPIGVLFFGGEIRAENIIPIGTLC
jgi:hypothetical protein